MSLFNNHFEADLKGSYGEMLTEWQLMFVRLFGRHGKVLRNVYLPKENGETSEVDVIFITQKGIFVFESKNYSGWIFGDEKSQYWTAMLPNKEKNQFYNPIKQNRTHLKWMRSFVGEGIPLFSIVVFSERCELKKVTVSSDDVKVIKREYLYGTVKELWRTNPDVLTKDKIDELHIKLKDLTKVDEAVKLAHIENIEKNYKNNNKTHPVKSSDTGSYLPKSEETRSYDYYSSLWAKKTEPAEQVRPENSGVTEAKNVSGSAPTADENLICPKCGSKLVLRTAKKGNNAGGKFYGCSGFPQCRYIQNIEV